MMRPRVSAGLLVLFAVSVGLGTGPMPAHADDPCEAFTWDVRHERALFAQPPQPLAAGQTPAASPAFATERLYQLTLSAASKVSFVSPPHEGRTKGVHAGLARVTVDVPGVYRLSLDQPVWVDVIAGGAVIAAKDHQGRPGCNAPHKVVEFALPSATPVILQFSGEVPTVKVTVTRPPAPQTG
jgi:hypothetical protein